MFCWTHFRRCGTSKGIEDLTKDSNWLSASGLATNLTLVSVEVRNAEGGFSALCIDRVLSTALVRR